MADLLANIVFYTGLPGAPLGPLTNPHDFRLEAFYRGTDHYVVHEDPACSLVTGHRGTKVLSASLAELRHVGDHLVGCSCLANWCLSSGAQSWLSYALDAVSAIEASGIADSAACANTVRSALPVIAAAMSDSELEPLAAWVRPTFEEALEGGRIERAGRAREASVMAVSSTYLTLPAAMLLAEASESVVITGKYVGAVVDRARSSLLVTDGTLVDNSTVLLPLGDSELSHAVLDTAIRLWEPGSNGPFVSFGAALEAARALDITSG